MIICDRCHREEYGRTETIRKNHCRITIDRCNVCKQVEEVADCHCYLRPENMMDRRAPIRGAVR